MHILHGTWVTYDQIFFLWAEDTSQNPTYLKGRRGKTAPHPFQLGVVQLKNYLERFATNAQSYPDMVVFHLPGHKKQVQPSPEAQQAGWQPLNEIELLKWRIDGLMIQPIDFIDLMLQLPEQSRGFVIGSDLRYWQQVVLYTMNMLVEGRYLPTIGKIPSVYYAFWKALPDQDTFEQLQRNMPPVCRAIAFDDGSPQPKPLLQECFDNCLNVFITNYYAESKQTFNHEWLSRLTNTKILGGPAKKITQRLYNEWQKWQTNRSVRGNNFHICLRLNAPEDDEQTWHLQYLLQANDDPSLLVEAETVWASQGRQLAYLEHRFEKPQERLLIALGVASRIFPPLEDSLRTAKPTGMILDTAQAYQFLTQAVPMLESSGITVLVPNWWGKRARLKAKARIKSGDKKTSTGLLTRDSLLNYSWEASLGGNSISRDEFEQLVALKQPIVRYQGEWVSLDPEQIEAMLQFFEQAESSESELSLLDAFKLNIEGSQVTPEGIEIDETEVEDWLVDIFEQFRTPENIAASSQPENLNATLRPYQARGVAWLNQMRHMQLGACLADDMGLGKTIQTIAYWLDTNAQTRSTQPSLLICPTSVVGNWAHEISRFAPSLRYIKHQGANRLKDTAFKKEVEQADIVLTSYALLHRDLNTLKAIEWSSIVLDEAQNIKNSSTKQAQAARALNAEHRIALTGTPVENRLSELWSILHFLNPGYLGSRKAFRSNFATPIERYQDIEQATKLKRLTEPFILRRIKTDTNIIQDLPEKFENKVYCSLTPEQATLYEATVREAMEAIEQADEDMKRRGNILRMLTQLKQICNHPAQFLKEAEAESLQNRSGKLTRLIEMLEEIRERDERTLIFTQYAQMGTLLQNYLRDVLVEDVLFLHGGTPGDKRDEMVRRFQSSHGPPIFILSLKAGGTGLNLTHANHVFHYDRWYNPAVENQATDRAFRIGQRKDVQVHKFISLGTLEEKIDEMIEQKQALADQIIGAGENWISELDNNDLHDLVSLRYELVED